MHGSICCGRHPDPASRCEEGVSWLTAAAESPRASPVGGGVDVKLAGNWSARGEYRYSDYGTWRTTLGTPATLAVTTDIRMRTHTALFGLAYTFIGSR